MNDPSTIVPTAAQVARSPQIRSPHPLRQRAERLRGKRDEQQKRVALLQKNLKETENYLAIADEVSGALHALSEKLFAELLQLLEDKLTIALQEVLEQPLQFRAKADFKRNAAVVEFAMDRAGNREDVHRGQGGSVQNVLSVGLRMFALATLDETEHQRFLVLDEQDCWLRPELVPRLVHIVSQAAKELNFQVLMISHHDIEWFEQAADKIYRLTPQASGVTTRAISS